MVKFELPQGTGVIKKSKKYKDLKPNQRLVYDKVYDPVNGPLVFAENCCYVVRNGLERYIPFDYQREMMFNMHNYQSLISLFSRQNGKCFCPNIEIKIRNKNTKNIEKITIYDFFEKIKRQK